MNSTIVIATRINENEVEQICKAFGTYQKSYKDHISYFEMENVDWDEDYSQYSRDVAEFLSRLSDTSYAFVRVGKELRDVQINGSPEKFGINVSINLEY